MLEAPIKACINVGLIEIGLTKTSSIPIWYYFKLIPYLRIFLANNVRIVVAIT